VWLFFKTSNTGVVVFPLRRCNVHSWMFRLSSNDVRPNCLVPGRYFDRPVPNAIVFYEDTGAPTTCDETLGNETRVSSYSFLLTCLFRRIVGAAEHFFASRRIETLFEGTSLPRECVKRRLRCLIRVDARNGQTTIFAVIRFVTHRWLKATP
jgi:hypothetical protein